MKVTITNEFANDGSCTVRDPIKLLEMQVESALNMREEIFIPSLAENSDHDEELDLADISASDSGCAHYVNNYDA